MARKNNRGFSLVEVVVAVAILSLLLSPIIIQLAQTLSTSAEAKEKQYAVEDAEYVMEYFQKTDKKFLDDPSFSGEFSMSPPGGVKYSLSCDLYNEDGGTYGEAVAYKCSDYTLDPAKLGREKNLYNRTVTIDDLANKLLEKDYIVKYGGFTNTQMENLKGMGFTETNEGSFVKYDANGHITQIVCEKRAASGYQDPNTVQLGFIQDLDSSKVAIIQGSASNFDSQAEAEFYALKMQHLKEINPEAWQQAMEHLAGDNIFNSSSFNESVNKMTKISITSGNEGSNTYYQVSCNVYYEDTYSINGITGSKNYNDTVSYNVYSQKFYTNQAPDIYFIYEPFVDISTDTSVQYAANDYISIYNDDASKTSKVYLIKPDNSQLTVKRAATGVDENVYYTRQAGSFVPVKININYIGNGATDPLEIYTNIPLNGYEEQNTNMLLDDGSYKKTGKVLDQFKLDTTTAVSSMEIPSGLGRNAYPTDKLKSIDEDKVTSERLFTVTVTLKRLNDSGTEDGTVIRFSGAKGAN